MTALAETHATESRDLPVAGAFRRILVCLDRSEAAEEVLPIASHFARLDGGHVILLHVVQAPPVAAELRATDALEWEIVRQEARAYLDKLVELVVDLGATAESCISEGTAAHRVATVAAELQADLLVLSTFGEGETEAASIGGTAQKILAGVRIPVLVVPAGARDSSPHVPPRRILVPLDGSARGEAVLPIAIHLARSDGAEIVVAHVVSDPVRTEVLCTEEDLTLAHQLTERIAVRAEVYLDRIRLQLTAGGVPARSAVARSTDHREGLVALAAAEQADLIVLSAHGVVCNPRRPFGSVAAHVMTHANAPVLVVQDLPVRRASVKTPLPPSSRPPRSYDAVLDAD